MRKSSYLVRKPVSFLIGEGKERGGEGKGREGREGRERKGKGKGRGGKEREGKKRKEKKKELAYMKTILPSPNV